MNEKHEPVKLENESSRHIGRRNLLKLSAAAVAPLGLMSVANMPFAMAQESSTASAKAGVFAAIYERGSAYQKGKNILEQPTIKEHIAYTEALGDKLIAGGLLTALGDDNVVGMIIFEAESADAAKLWLGKDPGVAGKVLSASVRQWHVSNIRGIVGSSG